ncbi:SapC family protein [Colwellia sp. Bg11-28]|uniref:SapC family protein n=1 Tax=Colwellia sp. Bg11-28 TaxID=2058305 RepID=UPI000C346FA3|nr:SapC family protein [Colwellia sp. Bg11-28]PKH89435.1 multidrug transporter [Colwellia sp. Bg11-28]
MIPLNNKQHANLKVQKSNDVSRFKDQNVIPVTVQDFIPLSTEFPIVFVKNAETGQFISVALMGLRAGVNLYCQETKWSCPVAPNSFNNAPFSLVKSSTDSDEIIVCIDEESQFISTDNGEALFDEQGQQTEFLKQKSQALLKVAESTEQTQDIVNLFAQKKLLISKQLNVKLENEQEPFLLSGIYLIDEKALNSLSAKEFEELRTKGLLPLIYAHLASLHQITRLTIKQNEFEAK